MTWDTPASAASARIDAARRIACRRAVCNVMVYQSLPTARTALGGDVRALEREQPQIEWIEHAWPLAREDGQNRVLTQEVVTARAETRHYRGDLAPLGLAPLLDDAFDRDHPGDPRRRGEAGEH